MVFPRAAFNQYIVFVANPPPLAILFSLAAYSHHARLPKTILADQVRLTQGQDVPAVATVSAHQFVFPPYDATYPGQFASAPTGSMWLFAASRGSVRRTLPQQGQESWGAPPQDHHSSPEKPHSMCFKFYGTKETILNSQVFDPYGKIPFINVSDKKHATVRAADGTALAVIN